MKFLKWLRAETWNQLLVLFVYYSILHFVVDQLGGKGYYEDHIVWIVLISLVLWIPFNRWADKKIEDFNSQKIEV